MQPATTQPKEDTSTRFWKEKKIGLNVPIEIDGKKVTTLRFRAPTGADLMKMDDFQGDTTKTLSMIPFLCLDGVTPDMVDSKIDCTDLMRISNLLGERVGV